MFTVHRGHISLVTSFRAVLSWANSEAVSLLLRAGRSNFVLVLLVVGMKGPYGGLFLFGGD